MNSLLNNCCITCCVTRGNWCFAPIGVAAWASSRIRTAPISFATLGLTVARGGVSLSCRFVFGFCATRYRVTRTRCSSGCTDSRSPNLVLACPGRCASVRRRSVGCLFRIAACRLGRASLGVQRFARLAPRAVVALAARLAPFVAAAFDDHTPRFDNLDDRSTRGTFLDGVVLIDDI
jgi:hypothetical protein